MQSHTFDKLPSFPSVTLSHTNKQGIADFCFQIQPETVFPNLWIQTGCVDVNHDRFSFIALFNASLCSLLSFIA